MEFYFENVWRFLGLCILLLTTGIAVGIALDGFALVRVKRSELRTGGSCRAQE